MPIQHHNVSSDSGRTPIDRHAVSAAGQLLMSAIWLEHRVRRFPTHLSVLASPRIIRCACGEHLGYSSVTPRAACTRRLGQLTRPYQKGTTR